LLRRSLLLFFALIAAFALILQSAIIAFDFTNHLLTALMWSVGLAAILTLKITGQPLASLGWSWGPAKHHLIAFLLPIGYGGVAYGVAGALGLARFPTAAGVREIVLAEKFEALCAPWGLLAALSLIATAGLVRAMDNALGEEIGWRGFLTPRLTAAAGFVPATLLTGTIWTLWHTPILVFSTYNGGGDTAFEIASFAVTVISMSGVFAWLRLDSRSLWPAATLHASHDLFIQVVFDPLSARAGHHITMVSEFGVVTAAVCVLFSLPFWILGARRFSPPRGNHFQPASREDSVSLYPSPRDRLSPQPQRHSRGRSQSA
jgi:membrane protease YdiL (CAAX protease family)